MRRHAPSATRLRTLLVTAAVTLPALLAAAADLPDCHVSTSPSGSHATGTARYALLVDGALKNGVVATYAKDDPVLNTPIKVVRSSTAYTVAHDMKLHSSWALNPDYRFAGGQVIKVSKQLVLRDGRTFDVIVLNNGSILFVNDQGEFCNSAGKVDNPIGLVGTLTKVPDDASITRTSADENFAEGSLRIIYGGSSAGAMHFQEIWVQGTHIVQTQDRVFDQFATQIEIAGFKFEVSEAKADSIKVRYDLPSRSEVPPDRLHDFPIHGAGR